MEAKNKREPHIRVALTPQCNLKCVYCRPGGESEPPACQGMTREETVFLAGIAFSAGFQHIKFTGGEPLVRKDAARIIRDIHESAGFKSHFLITNGILLNEKAAAVMDAGVDHVVVSLDAADPEKFCTISRGTKEDFKNVLNGLKKCQTLGIPRTINAVIMKKNLDQLIRLTEISSEYGAKLKLIDLMDCNGNHEFWKEQFVPFNSIDRTLEQLSVKMSLEPPLGNLGTTMKRYELKNGATVIARDASRGAFYHETCHWCRFYPCQDAVYGARITHAGKLKRCLIRNDNLVDVLGDLQNGKEERAREKMRRFFRIFSDAAYQEKKWMPGIAACCLQNPRIHRSE